MGRKRGTGATRPLSEDARRTLDQINGLAWLLDNSIRLPGGFRIGLEAILGLVPFLGDAAGVLLSGYIVRQAARLGAPPSLLARMVMNVAVEGVIGMVPLAGDIFDAAWKANQRNALLLGRYLENPRGVTRASRFLVGGLLLLLLAFMALTVLVSALLTRWLWNALAG